MGDDQLFSPDQRSKTDPGKDFQIPGNIFDPDPAKRRRGGQFHKAHHRIRMGKTDLLQQLALPQHGNNFPYALIRRGDIFPDPERLRSQIFLFRKQSPFTDPAESFGTPQTGSKLTAENIGGIFSAYRKKKVGAFHSGLPEYSVINTGTFLQPDIQ